MSSSERHKSEYEFESELVEDYKKLILTDPNNLNVAAQYLFDSLLEDAMYGVAFQMHFESKYPVSSGQIFIQRLWKIIDISTLAQS
jgi:hypothetical protein